MINFSRCAYCGTALAPAARSDAKYCSGACRMAAHRLPLDDGMSPFAPRPKSSTDAVIDILRLKDPDMPVKQVFASPEQAMHRLHRAQRELAMARAAAMELGLLNEAPVQKPPPTKPDPAWENEKREQAKSGPAPKTEGQLWAEQMRNRDLSKPVIAAEPLTAEEREAAVTERWNNANAEERARMIIEAAAKCTRPPRSNK